MTPIRNFEFIKAHIVTPKHYKKLKQNEIHSSKAAKIIIESKNKMLAFVVMMPFIRVNDKGDIYVFTTSSFDEASLKIENNNKKELVKLKKQINNLKSKAKWGVSTKEIFELENLESSLAALEVKDKYISPEIGGGF